MHFRPLARNSDLFVRKLNDETIVYDLKTNNALYLNEVSLLIWKLCDGHRSVLEIRQDVKKEYGIDVSTDFIFFSIYQLRKDNLLLDTDDIDVHLKKYWGRRAIEKFQYQHALAEPKILSVSAPAAVELLV